MKSEFQMLKNVKHLILSIKKYQFINHKIIKMSIKVEIIDNGSGILPEDISHIFEPFFSAKHKESGIGLGLAIVHGIVQSHQGKIEAESKPGKGTTISITLALSKS